MPINWTPENDRKLLMNLLTNITTANVDTAALATLFPGATPKAIHEHIQKLRRELKATNDAASTSTPASPAAGKTKTAASDNTGNATPATKKKPHRSNAQIEAANAAAVAANGAASADDGELSAPAKRGRGRPPKATPVVAMKGGMEVRGSKRKRGVVEDDEDEEETGTQAAAKGKGVVVKKEGTEEGEDPFENGEMVDVD